MEKLSKDRISALTGVTYRTIVRRLEAAGVQPVETDGRVDLFDSVAALRAVLVPDRAPPAGDPLKAARVRLAEAQAAASELETARRRGELMEVSRCRDGARRAGMAVRDALLSVPGRIAAQLAGLTDEREIERLLSEAIRDELTRLADRVSDAA